MVIMEKIEVVMDEHMISQLTGTVMVANKIIIVGVGENDRVNAWMVDYEGRVLLVNLHLISVMSD